MAKIFRSGYRLRECAGTVFCCAAIAILPAPAQASLFYSVTDLGAFSGIDINNLGQVPGQQTQAGGALHTVLLSGGTLTDLGTLGGVNSGASAINDAGQLVGTSELSGGASMHGFLRNGSGPLTDLGTLGGDFSAANGINAAGTIAGASNLTVGGPVHAVLWGTNGIADLGTLGGSSGGDGVNDSGQVTGFAFLAGDVVAHTFLYSNGQLHDLGGLGGNLSEGLAINSSGQIAGYSTLAGETTTDAYLYSNGVMKDLGGLGGNFSEGFGVNNAGQVVGTASLATGDRHAFVTSNGVIVDLNTVIDTGLGLTLTAGQGINGQGQIVALGADNHTYLLTAATNAPEPSSAVLFIAALATLFGVRRISGRSRGRYV